MRPHLRPEPQDEPPCRRFLYVPGHVGNHHWATRKRHRNRSPEFDGRGRGRRHRQRKERIVLRLGCPQTAVADGLRSARILRHGLQTIVAKSDVKSHGELLGDCKRQWLAELALASKTPLGESK